MQIKKSSGPSSDWKHYEVQDVSRCDSELDLFYSVGQHELLPTLPVKLGRIFT